MTTIAFDGKVLASDARWANDDVQIIQRTKIMRFPTGALYGSAGSSDDRELIELLKKIKHPHQLPTLKQLGEIRQSLTGLFVFPSKRAFLIDTCHVSPGDHNAEECGVVEADVPVAIGTGAKLAIAAIRAGAGAYEAVKIAADLDTNSGPPVYRLTLNPRVLLSKKHAQPKTT